MGELKTLRGTISNIFDPNPVSSNFSVSHFDLSLCPRSPIGNRILRSPKNKFLLFESI